MENEEQTMMVKLSTENGAKLVCHFCNKALASLTGYVKHIKKHEPPGGFLCRYCGARFCSDDELKQHRNAQHTTIVCRLCKDTTFTSEADYRTHIRTMHNGIDRELFKCVKCGAEYKTIEPFRRHMTTECGTVKPHKCDECSMSFMTKYNLKHHKESHRGELKFCCSYCGKNFQQKSRLIEHERCHTGEKPYKCDVCGKCFAHRESIVTHSSIHTGIRLVECKCCQTRFSCYSNLIKHRRTRPETCGLPEYDPPKTRVRKHISRIPPMVNPTSEIKVSNINKIIKPDDQKKATYIRKEMDNEKSKLKEIRSKKSDFCDTKVSGTLFKATEGEKELEVFSNKKNLLNSIEKNNGSDSLSANKSDLEITSKSSSENIETSHLDPEKLELTLSDSAKRENIDMQNTNDLEEECLNFSKNDNYIQIYENTPLIEYQKNQLTTANVKENNSSHYDNLHDTNILEETEIIFIKDDMEQIPLIEQDILEVKPLKSNINQISSQCRVLVEDVKDCLPQLKHCSTVKIDDDSYKENFKKHLNNLKNTRSTLPRVRSQLQCANHDPINTSELQQKRNFRLGKLTQSELKERLKLGKKLENYWKCPHCIKIYYVRKPFEKHLLMDHQLSESSIQQIFENDYGILLSDDDAFKCHICGKIYLFEKRLINHMQKHGVNGKLIHKCPCFCSRYFASREEAINHAKIAHKQMLWCEICQKYLTGSDALKSHNARLHNKCKQAQPIKRNFICDKCGKKFMGRTQLTDHVRSDCGRLPIYQCKECGKRLTTDGILKTHMLLHNNDRPFQCKECGKSFKIKAQYKSHIRYRHSEDKRFKCHLCPKAYPYRESLLTHMTVHTGIKRFLCNGCGKRFTCVSNLQAHRKVQSDTCGLLPLNAKATQYMGVQKGKLLIGAKPEAGLDYIETSTVVIEENLNNNKEDTASEPQQSKPIVPSSYTVPEGINCLASTS